MKKPNEWLRYDRRDGRKGRGKKALAKASRVEAQQELLRNQGRIEGMDNGQANEVEDERSEERLGNQCYRLCSSESVECVCRPSGGQTEGGDSSKEEEFAGIYDADIDYLEVNLVGRIAYGSHVSDALTIFRCEGTDEVTGFALDGASENGKELEQLPEALREACRKAGYIPSEEYIREYNRRKKAAEDRDAAVAARRKT